jgi:hypothetical protein
MSPLSHMKKRSLITSVCAGALLTALSASTALAEIVYVTSTCSNVTSTTICGVNINNDYNETTWYKVYEEGSGLGGSFTSAKSTTPDKPTTPGARYWSTGWTNSTPDLGVVISPNLAVTGGVYKLYHVYSSTAGNVSQDVIIGVTNIENCTLSFTQTDKFQRKYGSPAPQQWQLLGYVTNAPDSSNPRVGFYYVSGTVNASSSSRFLIDTFRFVLDEPCLNTSPVGVTGPLLAGGTNVVVTLATNATKLTVYQDSGSGFKAIGSLSEGIVNGNNSVPVTGLVKGAIVGATQTVNGQEGCVPTAGMIVGGGPNPRIGIALSVREAVNATGPVGINGAPWTTNASRIHFLGASELSSGAPVGGTVVLPMNTWQTVTFQRGPDYLNPTNPTVIWNSSVAGQAGTVNDLQGDWGTLESIAFVLDDTTDTGPYRIYIDNIVNGGITNDPIVIEDFEDAPAKMSDYTFHVPGASGSTSGYMLSSPNEATIDNTVADTGSKSMRVVWQWSSLRTNNWIRFNTFNSTQGKPNPMFNLNDPISFRILIQPVGAPAPTPPSVPRPTLIMSKAGDTNVFEWTGAHRLQTATSLEGPFSNLPQVIVAPNTNTFKGPYTNVTSDAVRFYRLVD